jgi:isopenicillin N synthase-like dioxygenase
VDIVPIIDISPVYKDDKAETRIVAEQVGYACEHSGFFQVVGHIVDQRLIESVYAVSRDFFDLPETEKAKVSQPAPDQVRGWSGIGREGLSYSLDAPAPGDLKEKMDMGPPDAPLDDPYFGSALAGPHFAPTPWPGRPVQLRPLWERYYASMAALAGDIMQIFAVALNLDRDYFDDRIDRHISILRALNYPDQHVEPLPGQLRAGAHSDYGSLTIVRQESRPGGLEVLTRAGTWQTVPYVRGAFVVNIGDLMAEWTNDRWMSTLHRVVNPLRSLAHDSRRITLAFFHQPNYDAVIECLPTCLAPGGLPRHQPVLSGEHLRRKFLKQTTFGSS